MNYLKLLITVSVLSLFSISLLTAQQSPYKNYLNFNVSYAFFGTFDINGSSLGSTYSHMLSKRFGAQFSYKMAYGDQPDFAKLFTTDQLANVVLVGDAGHAVIMAAYKMVNIGPVYKINSDDKNQLLISAGLNYKRMKFNSPRGYGQGSDDDQITIRGFNFSSENEIGAFVQLQYLYFIKDNFSIGFHAGTQPGGNIVHDFGLTLGSRF